MHYRILLSIVMVIGLLGRNPAYAGESCLNLCVQKNTAYSTLGFCTRSVVSVLRLFNSSKQQVELWRLVSQGDLAAAGTLRLDIEKKLAETSVVWRQPYNEGFTRKEVVVLADGTVAIFKPDQSFYFADIFGGGGGYVHFNLAERASYELDRALDLYAMPVTVEREVLGEFGSLQVFVDTATRANVNLTLLLSVTKDAISDLPLAEQQRVRNIRFIKHIIQDHDERKGEHILRVPELNGYAFGIDFSNALKTSMGVDDPSRIAYYRSRPNSARLDAIFYSRLMISPVSYEKLKAKLASGELQGGLRALKRNIKEGSIANIEGLIQVLENFVKTVDVFIELGFKDELWPTYKK